MEVSYSFFDKPKKSLDFEAILMRIASKSSDFFGLSKKL